MGPFLPLRTCFASGRAADGKVFSSGADKFLQQYCTYCKKIWQSMAEIDLPVGLRLDAEQVLRGIFKSSLRAPLHNSFPSITRTEINIETP